MGCGTVERMAATAWDDLVRPALRDGLHVVRRDDRHLQVGLDPPDRLVLDDRPGLQQTLTHLDRRPPAPLRPVVDGLVRDGWVVDVARRGPGGSTTDRGHGRPDGRRPRPGGLRRGRPHPRSRMPPCISSSPSASRDVRSPTHWFARTSLISGSRCCHTPSGSVPTSSRGAPPACAASTRTSATWTLAGRPCSTSWRSYRWSRSPTPIPAWSSSRSRGRCATSSAPSTASHRRSAPPPSP